MQVLVDKNIYFQQCGDTVDGVYVNEPFISIKVGDRELNEEELSILATQIYTICRATEPIRQIIEGFAKEYEKNPNRDGTLIILTNEDGLEKMCESLKNRDTETKKECKMDRI